MGSSTPRLSGTLTGTSSDDRIPPPRKAALGSNADPARILSRYPWDLEQYLPLAGSQQIMHSKKEGKETGELTVQ